MADVLYVGDSAVKMVLAVEGVEVFPFVERVWDGGTHLQEVLERAGHHVRRLLSHEAMHELPETAEEFGQYDVVILSDLGHDTFVLYPGMRRNNVPMGPNRMKEIVEYVRRGGGLAYLGGYFTYQGHHGKGRWYGTPVAEILPVEMLPLHDDRVECPEGARLALVDPDHPITSGLTWDRPPIFMGYNRTRERTGARLLARIGDDGDPLVACWQVDRGRVLAFTSDVAPHWGTDFAGWPEYGRFWDRVVRWLSGELP